MAQTGYTPIKLYYSATASTVPVAGNLSNGELAINITDGKMYYKDNAGDVQVIASKATASLTLPLSATNGGTGQASYATGDILYAANSSTLDRLALGTTNYVLTAGASAPQYVAQSTLSVGNATTATTAGIATNLAGGANGSIPYQTGSDSTTMLAAGTNGYVLTLASGVPTWAAPATGGAYSRTPATATAGQTTFSVTYTVGYLQVYLNGVLLDTSDYTATNGTSVVLGVAANAGDLLDFITLSANAISTVSNIGGGAANQIPYQTATNVTAFSSGLTFDGTTLTAAAVADSIGNVRSIPINSQTTGYTITTTDNGKMISITTGGATVPNGVMSAGMVVTIYNNSGSNQTITQGSGLTLQWAGQSSSTTGNRTLGLYSLCTVIFLSSSNAIISGAGLS
jgi:hypothetical protein